jgi:tryptophan 2,3-dioxygenase
MTDKDTLSYGSYLKLDRVLTAQSPLTTADDEMLFIIQHQTSELWMKLAIHELESAGGLIAEDNLQPCMKLLSRVARIFEQLNSAWDVLRTMTPSDYTTFRDSFGASSGFQSWQYRQIEFLVGNKNAKLLAVHEGTPDVYDTLQKSLERPSLYDTTLALLAKRGFDIPEDKLSRDWATTYQPAAEVEAAWVKVYQDPTHYWDLYELAEKLVDFEDYFRRWRFNHVTTVERVIGFKRGSGGTSGVDYLKKMLDTVLFPELWSARTSL